MIHMAGKKVADFAAPATGGTFKLSEHRGRPVVLYFYPKDNTPGCTMEGAQFRDLYKKFEKADALVVGVSRDSLKSHESFKTKMKNMYGRQVRGIERSTFLIDGNGTLVQEWRGVKVPGHAEEVLAAVKAL